MKTKIEITDEINLIAEKIAEYKKQPLSKEPQLIDEKQRQDNIKYLETKLTTLLETLQYDGLLNYITSIKLGL